MELGASALGPDSVTSYMLGDHCAIDSLLDQTRAALGSGDRGLVQARLHTYATRLLRHVRLEEELIFPLFEVRTGVSGGPTGVLREEHVELRQVLDECQQAAAANDGLEQALSSLARLVHEHFGREERVIFPMLDLQLAPAERTSLVARLVRE